LEWRNELKEGEERVKQALARKYYSEKVKKSFATNICIRRITKKLPSEDLKGV